MSRTVRKRILVGAAVVVLLLVVLAALAKPVLIPAAIRLGISSAAGEHWRGEVEIDSVEFSFSSPIRLGGIRALDSSGRPWLEIGSVELTLDDWPGFSPVLTGVAAQKVLLQGYAREGRCEVPVIPAREEGDGSSPYLNLQSIAVRDIQIRMHTEDEAASPPWLYFVIASQEAGTSKPGPQARSGSLWPAAVDAVAVEEAVYREHRLKIGAVRARAGEQGRLKADLEGPMTPRGEMNLRGRASVTEVALQDLLPRRGRDASHREGRLAALCDFEICGRDPSPVTGSLAVVVEDADFWDLPILSDVLEYIHGGADLLAYSDVDASFAIDGALLTVERFSMANEISAMQLQKGGTLHLGTKKVDAYVVAALLNDIQRFLEDIPVVELVMDVEDALLRLHVSGDWGDNGEVKVSKEPSETLQQMTGFFVETTKAQGDIGTDAWHRLSRRLETDQAGAEGR